MSEKKTLHCSFCGRTQHEVRKLIAGPTVFICDECVDLCNDIVAESGGREFPSTYGRRMAALKLAFTHYNGSPAEIVGFARDLESYLLGQVEASSKIEVDGARLSYQDEDE